MTTLTIREGGYYRRRDGNVVGPIKRSQSTLYPWAIDGEAYSPDGTYDDEDSPLDLVAEVHVDSGERMLVAALRTNRGTQPTADGYYMCYVQRLSNPALVPVMLKRDNGRWFDTMYVPDPVVVTWCGPMPAVELGA